jgi:type I restriction enzyme S subunit
MEKLLEGVEVEWKPIADIADIYGGLTGKSKADFESGNAKYISYKNIFNNIDVDPGQLELVKVSENERQHKVRYGDILFTGSSEIAVEAGMSSAVTIDFKEPVYLNSFSFGVRFNDDVKLMPEFSKYLFRSRFMRADIAKSASGVTRFNVSKARFKKILVPIPCPNNPEKSLAIQAEIVRILDAFTAMTAELTAELNMRKKQYNYYRDQLLSFDEGDVEWKALGEVFNIFAGGDKPKDAFSEEETDEFNVPILSNGIGLKSLYGWTNLPKITEPSLTVSARGTIGWTSYRDRPFFPIIRLLVLTPKIGVNTKYAYYYMKTIENNYPVPPAGIPQLTKPMIENVQFPIPYPNDLERSQAEQARIVAILDKFDALTNSITEGLPREIELRQKQYEYYRDLLLSFPKSHSDEAA